MCNHTFSIFSRRSVASLAVTALSVGIMGANFSVPQVAGAFAPPAAPGPEASPVVSAVWQTVAPVVDGNLSEWSNAQHYPLDNQNATAPGPDQRPEPSDLSAWASIVWTTDNLYVAVNVTDDVVVRTHRNWLLDDMAQFTFDIDNSSGPSLGDVYLTVSPDGLITNGGLLPLGYESKAVKTPTGWQAEVSIPLREFGADFLSDAQVGFTWGVQDNDGQSVDGSLVWAGPDFVQPTPQQGALSFVNGPTREWISARPGVNGYNGITDTTLNSWPGNETKNFGSAATMAIRGDLQWHLAFKSVPPALPPGARVLKARVHMTVISRNNKGTTEATMYRLLRPWDENSASWNNANATTPWAIRGANAVGVDRGNEVISRTRLNVDSGEVVWEVGPDVISDLYGSPEKNHGFLLRGEDGANVLYTLHSSECTAPANCTPWIEVFIEKPPALTSAFTLEKPTGPDVPPAAAIKR